MIIEKIDSKTLKNMFIAGAKYLEVKKDYVDELNVFPVPDGDTGTNMTLTIMAAAKEVSNADDNNMAKIAKAISGGSLRGARGNSGVILSQLFRGFAKEVGEYDELDTVILANALQKGVETAYKAVMKPKEGTILTVAKEAANKAIQMAVETNDILTAFKEVINFADETLQKTPDMLPVLKEAGVVDAGGQGLLYILKGAYYALENGDIQEFEFETIEKSSTKVTKEVSREDITFGYCTEFIINVKDSINVEKDAVNLRKYLETIGDSIVAVADDDIIKIHVHTNNPGDALQQGLKLGELINIKIDNMREQHRSIVITEDIASQNNNDERKQYGFVVVSIGEGLSEIFKSLNVDHIVEGGQTMNPSTEDLINAINKVNADNVFVLPNNKNIILAAQQAKDLIKDKQIYVIPSKSIPQGITAMINFDQSNTPDENFEFMSSSLHSVTTGQITYAVRDTNINEKSINQGDIIGIGNDKILAVDQNVDNCAKTLIDQLINDDSELITIYYGKDINEDSAYKLSSYIEEKYEDCDVEIHYGGQPLYYYILSIE